MTRTTPRGRYSTYDVFPKKKTGVGMRRRRNTRGACFSSQAKVSSTGNSSVVMASNAGLPVASAMTRASSSSRSTTRSRRRASTRTRSRGAVIPHAAKAARARSYKAETSGSGVSVPSAGRRSSADAVHRSAARSEAATFPTPSATAGKNCCSFTHSYVEFLPTCPEGWCLGVPFGLAIRRRPGSRARGGALRPAPLRLPAPVAFDRRLLLHAQIHLPHVLVGRQLRGCSLQHDAPRLQHVTVFRHLQRQAGVLFHQQNRRALPVDLAEHVRDLVHEPRRQSHRRLVQQQQPRAPQERPSNRQHLLLAS